MLRLPSLASRVIASNPARFDLKVGRDRKPKNPVDSTLKLENSRSNQSGELAVTREVRLGECKLIFHFSKIYALKNTANQATLRNITGTHIITVLKIMPASGP